MKLDNLLIKSTKMQKDKNLGTQVQKLMVKKNIETPFQNNGLEDSEKINGIEFHFSQLLQVLGLDLTNDSLKETPKRLAKMYVSELFTGLNYNNFPKCTTVKNEMEYSEPVVLSEIEVMTTCEHHYATIEGRCTIKYIPSEKVIGLSKPLRIVDFFSRRPQIQERLTLQIFHALCFILDTPDVSVEIVATHNCIKTRGVKQHEPQTKTSMSSGFFKTNK